MTKKTIQKILKALASEYSKKWEKGEKKTKIKTWIMMLSEVTDERGLAGLKKALEDPGDFMPPIGKFKKMCLSGAGCKNFEDAGREAWALVNKNLSSSMTPVFRDAAIVGTINRMGGWAGFCRSLNEKNLPFKQKEFVAFYVVCRNAKEENFPVPERTRKFFQGGEHKADYRFIGQWEDPEKSEALKLISQKKRQESNVLELFNRKQLGE